MDKELEKQLESLAEGETLEVIEGDELVTYLKPIPAKLCKKHEFAEVGNGEKICIRCGQGRVGGRL